MKILIADTLYPDFLKTVNMEAHSYSHQRDGILYRSFGTFDAYSRNLRKLGWDATDVIVNAEALQTQWVREYGGGIPGTVLRKQIVHYDPDVLLMQDLNVPLPEIAFYGDRIVAGQCSCPMPPEHLVEPYDVLFTSFPHYIARFEALGVQAVYNPLAFDPIVLDRLEDRTTPERNLDVIFIGGVGNPGHWQRGMETLEAVAREIPTFKWWGYGIEILPPLSPLICKYQGPAWGLDMYRLFRRAKIVLNRHGDVAGGYANNMRLFEATGCGAALLTEAAPNLSDFFVCGGPQPEVAVYSSPAEAVERIRMLLDADRFRRAIAEAGQKRTLAEHTYRQRMATVSGVLQEKVLACPR